MSGLPGMQTIRTVRIRWEVRATVEATVRITDEEVREHFGMDPDAVVDWEEVEEYAIEETDESVFDVESIDMWDKGSADLISTDRKHVAPPEFVPLPGMEGTL